MLLHGLHWPVMPDDWGIAASANRGTDARRAVFAHGRDWATVRVLTVVGI